MRAGVILRRDGAHDRLPPVYNIMPNTLSHLTVHTICGKALFRHADFKWIALGCLIPDLPWITQRLAGKFIADINLFDLRLYCLIQASFFLCLLLCGTLALLARDSRRVFTLLATNSLLHLIFDSLQVKWGNGVHIFAPFSWSLLRFDLFWPEDFISHSLTAAGLAILVFYGYHDRNLTVRFIIKPLRVSAALLLLLAYLLLPLSLFSGPREANNHFITTLRDLAGRPGKRIEFDRRSYLAKERAVLSLNNEKIRLVGELPDTNDTISLQGRFIDQHTIKVSAVHVHGRLRDISSMLGLAGITLTWLFAFLKKSIKVEPNI